MVTIKFQYSKSEYIEAYRKYLLISKRTSKFNLFMLPIGLVIVLAYAAITQFSKYSIILLVLFFLVAILEIVVWCYIPAYTFNSTAKFQELYTLSFSDEEIYFQTPSIDSHLQWDIYKSAIETDKFYFLIQSKQIYTIIPKRAFRQEEELIFKELIKKHLS